MPYFIVFHNSSGGIEVAATETLALTKDADAMAVSNALRTRMHPEAIDQWVRVEAPTPSKGLKKALFNKKGEFRKIFDTLSGYGEPPRRMRTSARAKVFAPSNLSIASDNIGPHHDLLDWMALPQMQQDLSNRAVKDQAISTVPVFVVRNSVRRLYRNVAVANLLDKFLHRFPTKRILSGHGGPDKTVPVQIGFLRKLDGALAEMSVPREPHLPTKKDTCDLNVVSSGAQPQ